MSAKKIPFGYVYEITNTVNGKTYIGQRRLSRDRSWREYLGSGKLIKNAIEKYGKENFVKSLITYAYSQEELNELEYQSIKKGKKSGKAQYNLYTGPGAGGDTFKNFTPERKEEAYRKRVESNRKAREEGRGSAAIKKRNSEYWGEYFRIHGEEIIEEYKKVGVIRSVAENFNIPFKRIYSFFHEAGIELNVQNKKGRKCSYIQKANISAAHRGETFSGTTEEEAIEYLEEARERSRERDRELQKQKREMEKIEKINSGVYCKPLGRMLKDDQDFIYAYMELKLSLEELQERYNCKHRIIYTKAKELGLPTPAARFRKSKH